MSSIRFHNDMLSESAQKMVRLFEERGVAGYAWRKEITDIVRWIANHIKENANGEELQFSVPYDLSNKIDFFEDVDINIIAKPIGSISFFEGGFGSKKGMPIANIKTNKFINCYIIICCFYDENGKAKLGTIIPTLYHEINHAYHAYIIWSRYNQNTRKYQESVAKYKNIIGLLSDDRKVIKTIIYRLFSETEKNAFVCNLYGELVADNVDRFDFWYWLPKSETYKEYKYILDNYESAIDELDIGECRYLKNAFSRYGIYLPYREIETDREFKKAFKGKTKILLDDLIKRFGKVSSLWFDEKESNKKVDYIEFTE